MIGDIGYDLNPMDRRLHTLHRIRLITPHKFKRSKKTTTTARIASLLPPLQNRAPLRLSV
jgi:hypothetical protein